MSGPLNLTRSPVYPGHRRRQRIVRPEARQIIRLLEKVRAISGDRAEIVFADWLAWLEALLTILPAHLTTATRTGQSHTAPVQELRSQTRGWDWGDDHGPYRGQPGVGSTVQCYQLPGARPRPGDGHRSSCSAHALRDQWLRFATGSSSSGSSAKSPAAG